MLAFPSDYLLVIAGSVLNVPVHLFLNLLVRIPVPFKKKKISY